MRGWKIILLVAAFFAAVGALLWVASSKGAKPQRPGGGMKRLSGTVAEGLVYWSPKEPFPRASCDACRIGKVKAGVFSLSAFSTIEIDNLVVNVPTVTNENCQLELRDMGGETVHNEIVHKNAGVANDPLGVMKLASMAYGKPVGKICGIKINGLTFGRIVGKDLEPVFTARQLKSSGQKLVLHGIRVHEAGGERIVDRAEFVTEPKPAIVWTDGRIELPELLTMFLWLK